MTRPADFYERAMMAMHDANEAAWAETDPEAAVSHFTKTTQTLLGDPDAFKAPGALKPGETQFVVTGVFFLVPDRKSMILFATHGYPPSQKYARIGSADSRPGNAVQTRQAAVVRNTDEDALFRQILSSGRVGCSIYVPVMWKGECIGLFNTAAQARYMYDENDMKIQKLFAALTAAVWMGLGGPQRVADVAAGMPKWKEG